MVRAAILLVALLWAPMMSHAQETQIMNRAGFIDRVADRSLTRLGIGVRVTSDGLINGSAFGTAVTGTWNWRGNRFCRSMEWGSRSWQDSCQAVFISDGRVYFQPASGSSVYLNLP